MKVLLTGSTGYIGKRLLHTLSNKGYEINCFVRNPNKLNFPENSTARFRKFEVDLLKPILSVPTTLDIDVAFYLVHSMSSSFGEFMEEEALSARHFADFISQTNCRQIIYLSGISNSKKLSKHLKSRRDVEEFLRNSGKPLTVLRAGIIVGSGSASFEIIRDLMEKLPMMLAPLWVSTLCQPLAVGDLLKYFAGCMLNPATYNQVFDIGGSEILSYKEMLLQYSQVRGLKRYIWVGPFITPRISSYWLYFVTSTSYYLAANLVDSMKVEVVCKDNRLQQMLKITPLSYKEAVTRALDRINLNTVASSWTDAVTLKKGRSILYDYVDVPAYGVMRDIRRMRIEGDPIIVLDRVFAIGGDTGWYYANWIWQIRGMIDRMVGGVGLRRGRRSSTELNHGDALDFWRVLIADRENMRLLLIAEMIVPGEAWLDFRIIKNNDRFFLYQSATFMPKGVTGRLYWFLLLPIHLVMFQGMIKRIVKSKTKGILNRRT